MADHWILNARARRHHFRGAESASIKSFTGGTAAYVVDGGTRVLDASRYMVLNDQQPYEITIDAARPVESFCVFFRPGFAHHVYRDLTATLPALLDDPACTRPPPEIHLETEPHPHDDVVSPILNALRSSPPSDTWEHEECLHRLMEALLMASPAAATKNPELTRRLWIAHDFMRCNLRAPCTLADVARAAALSPNHLIRCYRAAFGRTPHRHLTELRLARARDLLRRRDRSVTDVCLEVGWSSVGSFSTAFRRRFGVPPSRAGDFGEAPGGGDR